MVVEWVTEDSLSTRKLRKSDFVVMQSFEGKLFDSISQDNCS